MRLSNPTTKNFFNRSIVAVLCCIGALSVYENAEANEPKRPNVIFVLADDLGIGDLEPTSSDCKIKTPNLKAMAEQGVTFLDAHSLSLIHI